MRVALEGAATLLIILLAAFFGFVGFMKAMAPIATLAEHGAWTVVLPAWLGRSVGWSEMGCALALAVARVWPGRIGLAVPTAGILIANQAVAALVHGWSGEIGALPQNAVLVAMLAVLMAVARRLGRERRA